MSTFTRLSKFSFLLVVFGWSIAACSSSNDQDPGQEPPKPENDSDASREKIVKACVDNADAFAKANAQCGEDYLSFKTSFLVKLGGPGCPKVIGIRDETALRAECFPSLESISCSDFMSKPPRLNESCKGQLQLSGERAAIEIVPGSALVNATDDRP